jgi:hypothetical protein
LKVALRGKGSSRKKVGKSQSIMSIQPNKIKDF